jgi:hypothetical protein
MPIMIDGCDNRKFLLSDEVYKVLDDEHPSLQKGTLVQLINGVDKSKSIGYHFNKDYITVCRKDAMFAQWMGVKKSSIKIVENKSLT